MKKLLVGYPYIQLQWLLYLIIIILLIIHDYNFSKNLPLLIVLHEVSKIPKILAIKKIT